MSSDAKLGEEKEFEILDLLLERNIELVKRDYKYDIIDFYYNTDDIFYEIELKSRRNKLNDYPTTLLARNKIKYYIRNKNNKAYNKQSCFFIIFGFPNDTNDKVYDFYYIQYLKSVFTDFEIWKNHNEDDKQYYLIPIKLLKPISGLISILENSKKTT
jgi:hypothetical protein